MKKNQFKAMGLAMLMATTVFSQGVYAATNSVSVNLNSNITFDVELANDQVHSDENASTLVPSDAIIAIDGGFFNSYYNTSSAITFPDNSPRIYGAIVKDGELINGNGEGNMLGFTYDGELLIDRVNITPYFVVNEGYTVNAWSVNQVYTDATAIMIITDDFDMSFNITENDVVFTVKDGKVIDQDSQTTQTVTDGTYKIIYKSTAYQNSITWNTNIEVGDSIEMSYTPVSKSGDTRWDNVKTAITGGRMLVIDGVDVSARTDYNSSFDGTADQTNSSVALRAFISVDANGNVLFQTMTGSFSNIAQLLVSQGAVNAISVDGGASTMIYSSENGFVTSAGRELASVLVVRTDDGTDVKPETVEKPSQEVVEQATGDGPSTWAVDDINQAISLGIIPAWMEYGYQAPLTRLEFCSLLVQFISAKTGKTVEEYRVEIGNNYDDFTFTDTDIYQVRAIASLGIVNGNGDGTFSPDDSLTREAAATMISRLVDLVGSTELTSYNAFADQSQISWWAEESVDFIASSKIMNGDGTNFNPQGTYTKEEAFITVLNLYEALEVN